MDAQTALDLQISQDVLAEVHFGGVNHCSVEAPCNVAQFHADRIARLSVEGAKVVSMDPKVGTDTERTAGRRPEAGARAGNQFGTFQVHQASAAQVRFLTTCLETRDLTGLGELQASTVDIARQQVAKGVVSKKTASAALDILANRPIRQGAVTVAKGNPATEKQIAFLTSLANQKGVEVNVEGLTTREASAEIDRIKALPTPVRATPAPEADLAAGIYRNDKGIFKVQKAVHGSGRMVAKILIVDEDNKSGRFEYKGLASRFVKATDRMDLEEAKKFGAIYGFCVNCGATLTDEKSIEAGIGPVCARKF